MNSTIMWNVTTLSPATVHISVYWGFLCAIISGICYGINYLPVKKFDSGDGMFFQWILSNAIFIGSFIVNAIQRFPQFQPLVVLGGFIWSTGNICVVPVIREIGMGMGLCLWGSMSIIIGWASGRFGWFGIDPQIPMNNALNYVGFTLVAISPFIFALVKTEINQKNDEGDSEMRSLINCQENDLSLNKSIFKESYWRIRIVAHKFQPKIIGVTLSIFSGTLYGLMFIPVTYVKNRYAGASQRDIDHLFAQCSGIYLGSSLYFVIYCISKRNKPILYPECILPGLLSGTIWFIAYIAYFVANEALSPAISQPIVGALPGVISILLGVIWFKEIKGMRNFLILIPAILISCAGVILTGLSKVV